MLGSGHLVRDSPDPVRHWLANCCFQLWAHRPLPAAQLPCGQSGRPAVKRLYYRPGGVRHCSPVQPGRFVPSASAEQRRGRRRHRSHVDRLRLPAGGDAAGAGADGRVDGGGRLFARSALFSPAREARPLCRWPGSSDRDDGDGALRLPRVRGGRGRILADRVGRDVRPAHVAARGGRLFGLLQANGHHGQRSTDCRRVPAAGHAACLFLWPTIVQPFFNRSDRV
mmetsp:Transcript_14088/g.46168  ORF Transcript_14088/g.46168 Transcript_14088/m.46168 type:complete len:225 (+) Transcript_14088:182-856(+)